MRIEQGNITKLAVDAIVAGHPDLEVVFCCFSARDTKIYSELIAS